MRIRDRVARVLEDAAYALRYGSRWPRCRECWLPRSSGRHTKLAACEALVVNHVCPAPEEHHPYRVFR